MFLKPSKESHLVFWYINVVSIFFFLRNKCNLNMSVKLFPFEVGTTGSKYRNSAGITFITWKLSILWSGRIISSKRHQFLRGSRDPGGLYKFPMSLLIMIYSILDTAPGENIATKSILIDKTCLSNSYDKLGKSC